MSGMPPDYAASVVLTEPPPGCADWLPNPKPCFRRLCTSIDEPETREERDGVLSRPAGRGPEGS